MKLPPGERFIQCADDDLGVLCWEFAKEGWISEADLESLEKRGLTSYIKFIENHKDFNCWAEQCPECLSSVDHCDCEDECVTCALCDNEVADWKFDADKNIVCAEDCRPVCVLCETKLDEWKLDAEENIFCFSCF